MPICPNQGKCPKEYRNKENKSCSVCGEDLSKITAPIPWMKVGMIGAGLLALLFIGIKIFGTSAELECSRPSEKPILTLSGSNTVGTFMPDLAKKYLEQTYQVSDVQICNEGNNRYVYGKNGSGKTYVIDVLTEGTSKGFTDLASGKSDIAMASKQINDAQMSSLSSKGNMKSSTNEHIIAQDGIAIVVHPNNKVNNMSIEQLEKTFAGLISMWNNPLFGSIERTDTKPKTTERLSRVEIENLPKLSPKKGNREIKAQDQVKKEADEVTPNPEISEVGTGRVKLVVHNQGSGTMDYFNEKIMQPLGGTIAYNNAIKCEGNKDVLKHVSTNKDAIGIVSYGAIQDNKNINVKILALRANNNTINVPANPGTIAKEDYYLSRRLYLYTAQNKRDEVRQFLDFVNSDAAYNIIKSNGFIPTKSGNSSAASEPIEPTIYEEYPSEYKNLVRGLKTMPYNIRFEVDSNTPDNKAEQDIEKAIQYFKNTRKKALLIGFTDVGQADDPYYNLQLSIDRAQIVTNRFGNFGIQCQEAKGFGGAVPLGDNRDRENGRPKNRRVEIFVKD